MRGAIETRSPVAFPFYASDLILNGTISGARVAAAI